MNGLLGAAGLVASMVIAILGHVAWENYRTRRCDACRIERDLIGRSTIIRRHACSKRRWPYRETA